MKGNTEQKREIREWWASLDGVVMKVTGYSCAPNAPEAWWCPEVGHTLAEGGSLFATRQKAFKAATRSLRREIEKLQERLAKLERDE